jgi:hypothetical protein
MSEMKISISRVHAPTSSPLLQHQLKITASFKYDSDRGEFAQKIEALVDEIKAKGGAK